MADTNNNHIYINLDSLESSNSITTRYWIGKRPFQFCLLNLKGDRLLKHGLNVVAKPIFSPETRTRVGPTPPYTPSYGQAAPRYPQMVNRGVWNLGQVGINPKPRPLRHTLGGDLSNLLKHEMYMGFLASIGVQVIPHYIMPQSFNTNGIARP
eukprot:Gb_12928 [translate_table: standard]